MKVELNRYLEDHPLSKVEIANKIGVSRQTLHAIETSKYCPSIFIALKLAKILKVDVTEIFKLEKEDL
ncbi:MAG: helix-turn-helix domain-containing protein [Bacteriovoracaceae bacterium]|nr:helix-turn-helix domain-containing protein [Bacteriovoracaceae bacterium]